MLFDLSDRTQLELTGADRAKFLHGFCTNDIKSLTPSRGCEAFVCNIQGKVLGRIFVFCAESSLWIDSEPGQEDALFNHLDRYLINEDVQIHRRSAEYGALCFVGPFPDGIPVEIETASKELSNEPVLSHITIPAPSGTWQLRRVDWLGGVHWLLSGPKVETRQLLERNPASDSERWNALRIEAGFPLYGVDITSDHLAQEVGRTERCISFRKGCYLGQEPIARIDALGHVNRELRRLLIDDAHVPASCTALLDPQTGTQVGVITSAAPSANTPGIIVGLGYMRTKFYAPGTNVVIAAPAGHVSVQVAACS